MTRRINLENASERNYYNVCKTVADRIMQQGHSIETDDDADDFNYVEFDEAGNDIARYTGNDAKLIADWDNIVSYMTDDVREQVHSELAPCTEREFLARYLELEPEFVELLKSEFSIEM